MDVVVKAFSRPFYLDRCLTSIRSFADNCAGVTVLDDGLLPEARRCLEARHPQVRFVSAPWCETKPRIIRQRMRQPVVMAEPQSEFAASLERVLVWPGEMDPLIFWRDAIGGMEARHILLLEEDTWITAHLDLALVEAEMERANCLSAAIFCHDGKAFGEVVTRAEVGETAIFEVVEAPMPPRRDLADTYFPVSLAFYRREFWLSCHEQAASWLPEAPIHDHAVDVVAAMIERGEKPSFARIMPEVLTHGFSLSTRIPPSQYGADITLYDISDLLSEAWRQDRLDPMHDFPADFSEAYLSALIGSSLGDDAAVEWRRLRRTYEAGFAMGVHAKGLHAKRDA